MSKPSKEVIEKLEAEHGPLVFLSHPDGSCFGFKVLTREAFEVRETRVKNGDLDADDKLLQERCVWPSRDEWNQYMGRAAFETSSYVAAYRHAFGGKKVRTCETFEIPEAAPAGFCWLTNGDVSFAFRKPTRAEVKLWAAKTTGRVPRQKGEPEAAEWLLRTCAESASFHTWIDQNPFGVGTFSDPFVDAFGAGDVRVTGK